MDNYVNNDKSKLIKSKINRVNKQYKKISNVKKVYNNPRRGNVIHHMYKNSLFPKYLILGKNTYHIGNDDVVLVGELSEELSSNRSVEFIKYRGKKFYLNNVLQLKSLQDIDDKINKNKFKLEHSGLHGYTLDKLERIILKENLSINIADKLNLLKLSESLKDRAMNDVIDLVNKDIELVENRLDNLNYMINTEVI